MRRLLTPWCVGLGLSLGVGVLGCGKPQAAVVCHITYGGEAKRLEFPATKSPYAVTAVDIAGRFAFKAIYLQEPFQARSIHLYAYDRSPTEDRLIQEGKYAPPYSEPAGAGYGFTGRQLVYSRDQRELEYWCEVAR